MQRWCTCAVLMLLAACSAHQQQQAQRTVTSAAVATAVQAKLASVDADAATQVHVDANGGTITLRGQAHSMQERSAYTAAAASAPGVQRVVDRLSVDPRARGPREDIADALLAAKVRANIAAQAGINAASIAPAVRDGVVTLRGNVPSASVKATILQTARATSGVKLVIDQIHVKT